jgi:hypothetical protein
MLYNEIIEKMKFSINNTINYTDRAKRDMKSIHFTEDILKDILLHPTKIDEHFENNYIVHGKKTAKIRVEFTGSNIIKYHSLYNVMKYKILCYHSYFSFTLPLSNYSSFPCPKY